MPDSREGDDPLGWEGFNAVPVDEHHVPPVREARRVGTTLVVGAGALAALLAVAALTAPGDDDGGTETEVSNVVVGVDPRGAGRPARGRGPARTGHGRHGPGNTRPPAAGRA